MQEVMLNTNNLNVLAEAVDDLILTPEIDSCSNYERFKVIGVVLGMIYLNIKFYFNFINFFISKENGRKIRSNSVIITTGTFLRANINLGLESRPAGRLGDKPSEALGISLEKIGFQMGRLKTGLFNFS